MKVGYPVVVVCDDEEFKKVLSDYPVEVILTPSNLKSGSDRIAYTLKNLDYDVVVNLQGDEPTIHPQDVKKIFQTLEQDQVATLSYQIENEEDYINPNVVKVITDKNGYALYFSRSPIPFYRDIDFSQMLKILKPQKHIGVYGYHKDVLLEFSFNLKPSPLEEVEKLEQLRLLYNGYKIKVIQASKDSIGIDTKEDYERFCSLI